MKERRGDAAAAREDYVVEAAKGPSNREGEARADLAIWGDLAAVAALRPSPRRAEETIVGPTPSVRARRKRSSHGQTHSDRTRLGGKRNTPHSRIVGDSPCHGGRECSDSQPRRATPTISEGGGGYPSVSGR